MTLGTLRLCTIYTSVGVTSAIVFEQGLIVVVQAVKNKAYNVAFPQSSAPPYDPILLRGHHGRKADSSCKDTIFICKLVYYYQKDAKNRQRKVQKA
jgi:hypothetical protein